MKMLFCLELSMTKTHSAGMHEKTFDSILSDDQMRAQLERREVFFFKRPGPNWQLIERQIERLGFGEKYFVTCISAVRGELTKITPSMAHAA
jgi:hypothetical protein